MTELFEQSPFDPAKERRIVIIADWLPPDFGAVGQYMQMRAQRLAEQGTTSRWSDCRPGPDRSRARKWAEGV